MDSLDCVLQHITNGQLLVVTRRNPIKPLVICSCTFLDTSSYDWIGDSGRIPVSYNCWPLIGIERNVQSYRTISIIRTVRRSRRHLETVFLFLFSYDNLIIIKENNFFLKDQDIIHYFLGLHLFITLQSLTQRIGRGSEIFSWL